jgi:hypothetical protein
LPLTGHATEAAIDAPVRVCESTFVSKWISQRLVTRRALARDDFELEIPNLPTRPFPEVL